MKTTPTPDDLTDRDAVFAELLACGGYTREEARARWNREAETLGWNVNQDVARCGVTPHVHDDAMERLYRVGDGFIFETLNYWLRPERQGWTQRGVVRLQAICRERGIEPSRLRLLMLGDGTGSDTLRLLQHGFRPDYFDVPDSVTSAFSRARFTARGVSESIRIIEDFEKLPALGYDAIWSFDVLEHLPALPEKIIALGALLDEGGIAVITESCRDVRPDLPTHLEENRQYDGHVPALFLAADVYLTGFQRRTDYRPSEYRKATHADLALKLRSGLLRTAVRRRWFA